MTLEQAIAIVKPLNDKIVAEHKRKRRDAQFLSVLKSLQPSQAQVGAVAEATGCPEWTDKCCNIGSECFCEKAAKGVLENHEAMTAE